MLFIDEQCGLNDCENLRLPFPRADFIYANCNCYYNVEGCGEMFIVELLHPCGDQGL